MSRNIIIKKVVSFGCSFVRNSIEDENKNRQNRGIHTINHNDNKRKHHYNYMPETETNFTLELGEMLGIDSENYSIGGTGIRSMANKVLSYIEQYDTKDIFIIMGVTEFTRLDFPNPNLKEKCIKLPVEEYAKYYDEDNVVFEIRGILKMLSSYLKSKDISHLFINTYNHSHTISDIVDTLQFPNSEFWVEYIESYDSTYELEHPNIDDHIKLAKLIYKKVKKNA